MDAIHSWIDKKEVDDFVQSLGEAVAVRAAAEGAEDTLQQAAQEVQHEGHEHQNQQDHEVSEVSEATRQQVKKSLGAASAMAAVAGLLSNDGLQKGARIGANAEENAQQPSEKGTKLRELLMANTGASNAAVFDRDGDVLYYDWDGNVALVHSIVTTMVNSFLFQQNCEESEPQWVHLSLASGRYVLCTAVQTERGVQCVACETHRILQKQEMQSLAGDLAAVLAQ